MRGALPGAWPQRAACQGCLQHCSQATFPNGVCSHASANKYLLHLTVNTSLLKKVPDLSCQDVLFDGLISPSNNALDGLTP